MEEDDTKLIRDLERLKRQIHASEKNLGESLKKAEKLGAAIGAEFQPHQSAKHKRKIK